MKMLYREATALLLLVASCYAVEEILMQQHYHGEQFFDRTWEEFKTEFGSKSGNYWIGNERLHQLASTGKYYLRVDMQAKANYKFYQAVYKTFNVGPESDGYRLTIRDYSGTAGDSLYSLDQMKFTTKDRDNDKRGSENCAENNKGGFWFNDCALAWPNAVYNDKFAQGGFAWKSLPVAASDKPTLSYIRMYLVAFEEDLCANNPCVNGGKCVSNGNEYACRCPAGYCGINCQNEPKPDPCVSNPCLNGGTCEKEGDEFACRCAVGFAGDRCQKDETECKKTPPEDRINCGWGGVTSSECSQRSCCYDTTYTNRPVCFYQAAECFGTDEAHRADCGFDGISYPQCIGRGCCYDDDPDTNPSGPVCFRKANARCTGVPAEQRIQQGDPTIHPNVCLANGWCYETSAEPNCFSLAI
jgi:hypothetical protein